MEEKIQSAANGSGLAPLVLMLPLYHLNMNSLPCYKYSDPAVVLMSKVYQTTDSIHVETATLPGNSPTNRDGAGVCLSLSEYHYGMSRSREEGRERLLITAYNAASFSVHGPRRVKLSARSQDQKNHHFLTTRGKEREKERWEKIK